MRDREKLKHHVCNMLKVKSEDLLWSDKCNNPTEGFSIGVDNTQVAIAGRGYWVLK